ncbi:pyridoxamine 5'-phosphate oxidase family protein [Nonomuraea sp. NPDC050680]|uniref:pyridoxamine 5'-phosphate oxidase family protein n=1 Tax=Nonomuraea sp. NPDC050680 TaxID=3154630 RepID=UPI0033F537CE
MWDDVGSGELEVLSPPQCLELLGSVTVGRLGFTQGALPVIWPTDFLLHGEQVVIGTGRGGEWTAATAGSLSVVAFQADRLDERGRALWSVLVVGQARLMLACPALSGWADAKGRCIVIDIVKIQGRRFAHCH